MANGLTLSKKRAIVPSSAFDARALDADGVPSGLGGVPSASTRRWMRCACWRAGHSRESDTPGARRARNPEDQTAATGVLGRAWLSQRVIASQPSSTKFPAMDLPRDVQEKWFEAAVPHDPAVRNSLAMFLHDRHPKTLILPNQNSYLAFCFAGFFAGKKN